MAIEVGSFCCNGTDDSSGDAAGDGIGCGLSLLVEIAPTCAGPLGEVRLSARIVGRYVVLDDTGDSCEAATTRCG